MEEVKADPSNRDFTERRKPGGGVWLSHRQMYGGGLLAALVMIAPLKSFVWTREEGLALKGEVVAMKSDIIKSLDGMKQDQRDGLKDIKSLIKDSNELHTRSEDRIEHRIDHDESRLDSFEVALRLVGGKPKKSDN